MFNALNAEFKKQMSTRSIKILLAISFVLVLGISAIEAYMLTRGSDTFIREGYLTDGLKYLGVILLSCYAANTVTSEYAHSGDLVLFTAVPKRIKTILAKAVVDTVFITLFCISTVLISYAIFYVLNPDLMSSFDITSDSTWYTVPAYVLIVSLFSQGIAWLVKNGSMAISLVVVWITFLESALAFIPKIGENIYKWAPLNNVSAIMSKSPMSFDSWVLSAAYGIGIVISIWVVGCFIAMRRDC